MNGIGWLDIFFQSDTELAIVCYILSLLNPHLDASLDHTDFTSACCIGSVGSDIIVGSSTYLDWE